MKNDEINRWALILLLGTATVLSAALIGVFGLHSESRGGLSTPPNVGAVSRTETANRDDSTFSSRGRYAYLFDCSGTYLKVDTAQHLVLSSGKIWDSPSAISVRPNPGRSFDGCLLDSIQHDANANIIYAVVPNQENATAGSRYYRIVALQLPDFVLVGSAEIGVSIGGSVEILLTPDSKGLLVSFGTFQEGSGRGYWLNTLERYRVPEFELEETTTENHPILENDPNPMGSTMSRRAYWSKTGAIVDGARILDDRMRFVERADPSWLLSQATSSKLFGLERVGVNGKKYMDVAFSDSASDRTLFVVNNEIVRDPTLSGSALLVFDIETRRVIRTIRTPNNVSAYDPTSLSTPTARVTPDGRLLVVEHYKWREVQHNRHELGVESPSYERFKTGRIDIYDVETAALTRSIHLHPSPGFFARVLGFSPDGSVMYYGSNRSIYAVDLVQDQTPRLISAPDDFSVLWTQAIVFGDQ